MQLDNLTVKAQQALQQAENLARASDHPTLSTDHVLAALLEQSDGVVPGLVHRLGSNPERLGASVQEALAQRPKAKGERVELGLDESTLSALETARREASRLEDRFVSTEHLLLGVLGAGGTATDLLHNAGIDRDSLFEALEQMRGNMRVTDPHPEHKYDAMDQYGTDLTEVARRGKLDPVIGRDEEIRRVLQVLSRRTKNNPVLIGEPGVGKTAIAEGLAQRIIDGDVPQTLKDRKVLRMDICSMIAGAKYRGEFEDRLTAFLQEITAGSGEIILFIDELHTVVGAGAAEGGVDASNMLKPALARGELHCIGATTLSEYRKHIEKDPALERRFQPVLVGEPTVDETVSILRGLKERYEVHHGVRIRDSALVAAATLSRRHIADRFLPDKAIDLMDEAASHLRLEIDSLPAALDELERRRRQLEIEHKALRRETDNASTERLAHIDEERDKLAIEHNELRSRWEKEVSQVRAIQSLKREIEEARLAADRAEREANLERVAQLRYGTIPEVEDALLMARARLAEVQANGNAMLKEEVDAEEIAKVASNWTGIPVSRMLEGEIEKLLHMEARLHARVVGQHDAVRAVADAVRRARAGLQAPGRPYGSFMFLGPTGVGKTELAKSLAEFLFDTDTALIRLDMTEYMESHAVARMIGAPPGYVGHDDGGYLTEVVRRRPYSVILLDEIEKAHAEVFNILLQILDEGHLTDGKGRTVDFSNTVVIMTSNLGSQHISAAADDPEDETKRVLKEVRQMFRPEFVNRVDEMIVFSPLTRAELERIVDIQTTNLCHRLRERGIELKLSEEARGLLAEEAYDPIYGARPLRRVQQQLVENPLAQALLAGKFSTGDTIRVDIDELTSMLTFRAVTSEHSATVMKTPRAE